MQEKDCDDNHLGETSKIVVEFIPAEKWWKRAKWKLYVGYLSHNGKIDVPPGFISDGASIWLIFRPFFSPTGRYFGAAIIHDYILVTTQDWKTANKEFENEMDCLSIKNWRKTIMIKAVKLWSKIRKGKNVKPLSE